MPAIESRHTMRTAVVIGTGLIGTSAALALTTRGVSVYLRDNDPSTLRTAAALGAGKAEQPPEPVELAIVAVPPAHVGATVAEAQQRGLAHHFVDVASVKSGPVRELAELGCDVRRYIGSHPMAGKERSGPLAASADLFEGHPWVLTPTPHTETDTLNLVLELVALCRAVPIVMDPAVHDRAVALVSHTPQLVASMVAARLTDADPTAVRLSGQGIRDVTRIAASDPAMWLDILKANAGPVADVLASVAVDLAATVAALRSLESADQDTSASGMADLEDVLRRGNAGRARIPGKHGTAPAVYETVEVLIGDQPGELARVFADAGRAGVNIEDVRIEHSTGRQAGLVQLMAFPSAVPVLTAALRERGWNVRT